MTGPQDEALSKIRNAFGASHAEARLVEPSPEDSAAIPGFDRPHYGVRLSFAPPLTEAQAEEAVWNVLPVLPENAGVGLADQPLGGFVHGTRTDLLVIFPEKELPRMAQLMDDDRRIRFESAIERARSSEPQPQGIAQGAGLEDLYGNRTPLLETPRERQLAGGVDPAHRRMAMRNAHVAAASPATLARLGLQSVGQQSAPEGLAAIDLKGVDLNIGAHVATITPEEALQHRNLVPSAARDGVVRREGPTPPG